MEVFKETTGSTQADDDTYNLIMREKEKLLSFETPLKFIFSHSALREGWGENPKVFQIFALRETSSEQQRRQTIGRGLCLSVSQNGDAVPQRLKLRALQHGLGRACGQGWQQAPLLLSGNRNSLFTDDLHDKESAKIKCGEAHFAELATHNSPAARFLKATKLDDLLAEG